MAAGVVVHGDKYCSLKEGPQFTAFRSYILRVARTSYKRHSLLKTLVRPVTGALSIARATTIHVVVQKSSLNRNFTHIPRTQTFTCTCTNMHKFLL